MQRYAIIDGTLVVNVIEYESQPIEPIAGLDPSYIAVQSDIAGINFTYKNGIFTAPQPYPSWTLIDNVWTSPIPYPNDGKYYVWNESKINWVVI